MITIDYDRISAIDYANKWALGRNPKFYDFEKIGGDCTNFASQCLFSGCLTMNYSGIYGWYYVALNNRAPSWTGVKYFANFILQNNGIGPFGEIINISSAKLGDFIQLANNYDFYHTVIITKISGDNIFVSSHSEDNLNVPLSKYNFNNYRVLHILGARK